MTDAEKMKLDELFDAFSVIAEGAYVYLCNIKHDYSRWSKKAVDYFGLPGEYMYEAGNYWCSHVHPEDREAYLRSIDEIFTGSISGHDMQYRACDADGEYVLCTCRGVVLRDTDGKPAYFGGVIRNHGALSYIDPLTGLRSLYGFMDDIKGMKHRTDEAMMIMIGMSSFSDINEVYGYKFGNRVLQMFASKLHDTFTPNGAVYRMDGTRFTVLSHKLNAAEAAELYRKFQNYIKKDFIVDGHKVTVSINGGAIHADSFDIDPETYYSCLRYAYYESKQNKLGEFVIFENIVSADNRSTIERLNVIRSSVTNECKGFFLVYQPVVDASTEKVKGMESLIRWKNEEYGIVPPNDFINVLEQDTLFPELGRWILKQALTDGLDFIKIIPDLVINVNLSYTQLEHEGFVGDVLAILDETGFPPQNLCLEITERCRLLDMDMLVGITSILRNKGVKIALDDFGTGFSSLGIIREMPVDTIKIDRSFLKNIEKSQADRNTVRFISEIAHAFLAEVCAEGVENPQMRDWLRRYNISSFQGYYYSRPIVYEDMIDYLNRNK
ncbi:MAG: EAL domain-containing protein [Ruminococcus sp.]|nr:EAL domain-containing protein [Ruminococcus sp.]